MKVKRNPKPTYDRVLKLFGETLKNEEPSPAARNAFAMCDAFLKDLFGENYGEATEIEKVPLEDKDEWDFMDLGPAALLELATLFGEELISNIISEEKEVNSRMEFVGRIVWRSLLISTEDRISSLKEQIGHGS